MKICLDSITKSKIKCTINNQKSFWNKLGLCRKISLKIKAVAKWVAHICTTKSEITWISWVKLTKS